MKGPRKGYKQTPEHRKRIGDALRGKKKPPLSEEHRRKLGDTRRGQKHTIEARRKIGKRGAEHWNWQGGIKSLNAIVRSSIEYKVWRTSVFERDKWTCILCGSRPRRVEADHIKPFSIFPELRFDINNGRTLCVPCHRKTETYGFRRIYAGK